MEIELALRMLTDAKTKRGREQQEKLLDMNQVLVRVRSAMNSAIVATLAELDRLEAGE